MLLDITHQISYLNIVLLKKEEWGGEEKVFLSTEANLPSEERVLLQFHIQAFSSAHCCLLWPAQAALTVTLCYWMFASSGGLRYGCMPLASVASGNSPSIAASAWIVVQLSRWAERWEPVSDRVWAETVPGWLFFFSPTLAQYWK